MATNPTSLGAGGEDRVMATAQQIVKSLSFNTPKEVREDMLLILSSFDKRLSNVSTGVRFDAADRVILRWHSSPSPSNPDRSDNEMKDRAEPETAIQIAMSRLEDEFRLILIRNTVPLDVETIRKGSLFIRTNDEEFGEEFDDFSVELINGDAVIELKEIADRMMRSGYEKECADAYTSVRRDALVENLVLIGVDKSSIEQVQKIKWKALDKKMSNWTEAVKITVRVLLTEEQRLCYQILNGSGSDTIRESCFNEIAKGCMMKLLNFGVAVAIGKKSPEKLFRILDMHDALAEALPDLEMMLKDEYVISEVKGVLALLADAAKRTFVEFENAVKEEASKKPMQNGEIHPLTRYVMNYLKLLVDYRETLNSLLLESDHDDEDDDADADGPFAKRLLSVMSSLESNLEEKSKLYEDCALHAIFLMNNILYIVQKVKGSELGELLGDNWVRTRRGQVRQYETSYLRACWTKPLLCLKDEGIGVRSGSKSKSDASMVVAALKERFNNFNACFEDIYRAQTAWKVPDSQLREELRISISEKVVPAYRSFMGRFWRQLETGKQASKYIKYSPEDLENHLLNLFQGSPLVLRRKSTF